MPEKTKNHTAEQIEAINRYSIIFDGEKYQFGQYRYDKLEDAVSYAKTQDEKQNPNRATQSAKTFSTSAHFPTANYQSQYGTARTVSMFISFLGWVVFGIGVIAAYLGMASGLQSQYGGGVSILALLPGLGIAVSGLFLVAAGQVTRATVDNADHTREILNILKDKA